MLKIYSRGQKELAKTSRYTYSGTYMGERHIQCDVESPIPLGFVPYDFLEYRGERFELDYIPTAEKISSDGSIANAYRYSLKFVSLKYELERCIMRDIVLGDNNAHYTGVTTFSFFGDAKMLADRIQANLDKLYTGDKKWTVTALKDTESKDLSFDATNCWNALAMAKSEFELNFTVNGRSIEIGTVGKILPVQFQYGMHKGLYQITRTVADNEAVVTRLIAYGSDRNLPKDYNKKDRVPESQYITKLMLPNYSTSLVDCIESANQSVYGIREAVQIFDDIYPSIENTTANDLINAGGTTTATGRLDEVVSVSSIVNPKQASFNVWIKDIGFDLNGYLTASSAELSIKDGDLGGYAFEITKCVADNSVAGAKYKLTLNRNQDDNFAIPDHITNMKSGDHFVLLEIHMPEVYVSMAEQKLLTKAQEYLAQYDHAKVMYAVGVDEIYMARHPELAETIFEGDLMPVLDAGLNIDQKIIIQQITIRHEGYKVPNFDVQLSDEPVAGTLDRIQDNIDKVEGTVSRGHDKFDADIRRGVVALNRTKDRVFDTDGNINGGNIAPNSVSTNALSVGAKSRNFVLHINIKPNYGTDPNKLHFTAGTMTHRELKHGAEETDSNYIWNFTPETLTLADGAKDYYVYAKCSKNSSVGTWHVTEDMMRYDDDAEFYYLLLGDVYAAAENVRSTNFYYGMTWINGRHIYTGVIMSALGTAGSYFDLDNGILQVGSGARGYKNFEGWATTQGEIDAATNTLNDWRSDKIISPTEKTGLKQMHQKALSDKAVIDSEAGKWVLTARSQYSAFVNAASLAFAAYNKYTKAAPENIAVEADYSHIASFNDHISAMRQLIDTTAGSPFIVENGVVRMTDAFINNLTARSIDTRIGGQGNGLVMSRGLDSIIGYGNDSKETFRLNLGNVNRPGDIFPSLSINNTHGWSSINPGSVLVYSSAFGSTAHLDSSALSFTKDDTDTVFGYASGEIKLPNTATVDMPGVLCAGRVNGGPASCKQWGATTIAPERLAEGKFRLKHNLKHDEYYTQATPAGLFGGGRPMLMVTVVAETSSYVDIWVTDRSNENPLNGNFNFALFGKNKELV